MRRLLMVPAVMLLAAAGCERAPDDEPAAAAPRANDTADSPASWRLDAESFGPLRIGMNKDAIASLVPGTFSLAAPSEPGGCGYATWDAVPGGVRLMFAGDTLVRVEADSSSLQTTLGTRVGDSAARIDSLHGAPLRRMPHKYTSGQYLIAVAPPPADTLHRMVYETDSAGRVVKVRAGRVPQVEWVEGCS